MNAWLGHIRRWRQWLNWPALVAIAMAIAAVAFNFSVLRPAQRELTALQHKSAVLRVQHGPDGYAASESPRLQLVRFYESFPSGASAPNWLGRIHAAAQANHLELMQGDYRVIRKGQQRLAQYQMTLPVKGSYPDIRNFINAVLSDLPSISLDQIAFERQKIGESSVQATVRLTLFMRDES